MRWIVLLGFLLVACSAGPFCPDILDDYEKDECLLNTGLEQNLSTACDEIKNEHWKNWCYTDVANNLNEVTVCSNIEKDDSRADCIKNVAINTANEELCAEIAGTMAGDECYRAVAYETNNNDLCGNIDFLNIHNKCYVDVAEETNDYTGCLSVKEDDRRKDACIFRVSLRANNTAACADAVQPEYRDLCYFNHAIKFLDNTICDNVESSSMRSSCKSAVKLEKEKAEQ